VIDLIRIMASDHFFDVIGYVKGNPDHNCSSIARALQLHIATVQRSLDVLERHAFVTTEVRRKRGRPSKIYRYVGGKYSIDLDDLLVELEIRLRRIRETGRPDISFSFDVDRETVNAVLLGGKQGNVIRLDERMGRFLWLVPPPDSQGQIIAEIARKAGISVLEAVRLAQEMRELGVLEMLP
jgi:DNA-binding IclR family transcriptional regulator